LYARAGITEVWIVDVEQAALEVYRRPVADAYTAVTRLTQGESVSPLAFPGLTIQVEQITG
jgi:Uma2 family endonuclease